MPRVCQISGKKTTSGRTYTTRGLAKSKGGVGKKTTGKTLRTFKPNIQRVRAVVNGRVVRVKVAAKFLSRGMVTKPVKRKPSRDDA
ncbi:MAG: 50S ribosomal protein L28 [Planctomycetota bacterium]|nr:50S ribosomal protein L28 [Planctomycetota bacterium]